MDPNRFERALRGIDRGPVPPLSSRTEAMLRSLAPVRPASRLRPLLLVAASSLVLAALGIVASGDAQGGPSSVLPRTLRVDPRASAPLFWLVAVGLAWGAGFVVCLAAAIIPGRRSMLPDPVRTTIVVLIGPAAMVAFGAAIAGAGAGPLPSWAGEVRHGVACLFTGLETAAIPFIGGVLALRRALPIDPRAVGAALGAAGGALGALALHLRCPSGGMHVAVAHGGAAVVGALLGGAILPRIVRP